MVDEADLLTAAEAAGAEAAVCSCAEKCAAELAGTLRFTAPNKKRLPGLRRTTGTNWRIMTAEMICRPGMRTITRKWRTKNEFYKQPF